MFNTDIYLDMLFFRYRDIQEDSKVVAWLWQTLEEFSNGERVLFLKFVSGRSRLPSNVADISQRFQITKIDKVSPQYFSNTIIFATQICIYTTSMKLHKIKLYILHS